VPQKIFHLLLKEKNGGRKKYEANIHSTLVRKCKIPLCPIFHFAHSFEYKKCNEKISVLICRSACLPKLQRRQGAEASGNAPHYSGWRLSALGGFKKS